MNVDKIITTIWILGTLYMIGERNQIAWNCVQLCVVVKKVMTSPWVLNKEAGDFVSNWITADRPIAKQPKNSVDSLLFQQNVKSKFCKLCILDCKILLRSGYNASLFQPCYLYTEANEHSPSWEPNPEITRILWNPKVHYLVYNNPPPVRVTCIYEPFRGVYS
jgi:hypothetical protein